MKGLNHQDTKQVNKSLLVKLIAIQGPISRIRMSEITGLSKMTITNLVGEFIRDGIVSEHGTDESTSGRKPVMIDIVNDCLLTLGVYIGLENVVVSVINLKGASLCAERMKVSPDDTEKTFLRKLNMLIDSVLTDDIRGKLWGIGISAAGQIDAIEGVLTKPVGMPNLKNFNIVQKLSELYKLPAYLETDMNISALAEMYYGNAKKLSNFVYVGLPGSLGAGLIIDRKLFHGQHGYAGGLAHMMVDINGETCPCGSKGCLEQYIGLSELEIWVNKMRTEKALPPQSLSWLSLIAGAEDGDEICEAAMDRICRYLGTAISNCIHVVDPECVYIGGEVGLVSEKVLKYLNKYIDSVKLSPSSASAYIQSSRFPGNAAVIGTAALVMESNLKGKE